jgi:hypothetical protein
MHFEGPTNYGICLNVGLTVSDLLTMNTSVPVISTVEHIPSRKPTPFVEGGCEGNVQILFVLKLRR